MHSPIRRSVLRAALAGVVAGGLALNALAETERYPARPITLINPYAAGGPADTLARLLGRELQQRLGQVVVVDSKPGGAATIGTGYVARAKPDGYTLLIGTSAGHVVTPLMQRVPYDGIADFAFIGVVANQPNVLVVHPELKVDTLQDLIALARREPNRLNYASAGLGGATHLGAEAFLQQAQVRITHVPYSGAAPALKDLLGGQVQMGMLNLAATQAFIEQGKLKALAYGGGRRSPLLPQVPTMTEAGVSTVATSTWYTLSAPKGTPAPVIDALSQAMTQIAGDPGWQQRLEALGAERLDLSPAQTTGFVQQDHQAMAKLLASLNLIEK